MVVVYLFIEMGQFSFDSIEYTFTLTHTYVYIHVLILNDHKWDKL